MSLTRLYMSDMAGARRLMSVGMLRKRAGSGGLVAARNKVAKTFLDQTECEWLFMVDSDMSFDADIVERLVASADRYDRPIVGALCFGMQHLHTDERFAQTMLIVPTLYEFVDTGDEVGFRTMPDYERDAMVKVAGTGAAAVLIHRRALYLIRQKYGDVWYDPITHPTGPTTFSEDLSFCVRAAGCDLPIFVDTSVQTAHDKGGIFLDQVTFEHQPVPVDA